MHPLRLRPTTLVAVSLLLTVSLVSRASADPLFATPVEAVTVSITTTGSTVWGKVTLRYTLRGRRVQKTCSRTTCRFHVPLGVRVHLRQQPTDATTWPFKDWEITPSRPGATMHTVSASSLSMKVQSGMKVQAVYVVATSSSSSGGGGGWPY
jgi:hypothetical protein